MSFKKLLSLVLVLCMVLSLFPMSAFAEDVVEEEPAEAPVEEIVEEPAEPEDPAPAEEADYSDYVIEEDVEDADRISPVEVSIILESVIVNGGIETVQKTYTVQNVQTKTVTESGSEVTKYFVSAEELAAAETAVAVTGYHFKNSKVWDPQVDETHAFAATSSTTVYAKAEIVPNQYSVSYTVDPAGTLPAAKVPVTETVNHGAHPGVYLAGGTAVPSDGLNVTGKVLTIVVGSTTYKANASQTALDVFRDKCEITADTEVTLKYTTSTEYTVIFDYAGATEDSIKVGTGGSRDESSKQVTYNNITYNTVVPESAYNPTPTSVNEGEVFLGWKDNISGDYTVKDPITVDGTKFTADFAPKELTVTYVGYDKTEKVKYGQTAKGYTPTDIPTGKNFLGWSLTKGGNVVIDLAATPIKEDTNLYAVIGDKTYTVKFNHGGDPDPAFNDQTVVANTTANDPGVPTKFSYYFVSWKTADGKKFDFSTAITKDTVLTADWGKNTYKLAIDTTGMENAKYGSAALVNPVATSSRKSGDPDVIGFKKADIKATTADGLEIDSTKYLYWTVDDETEPTGTYFLGSSHLYLNENMVFTSGTEEHTYTMTLVPVVHDVKWTVKFDNGGLFTDPDDQTKHVYKDDESSDQNPVDTDFTISVPAAGSVEYKENWKYEAGGVWYFLEGWYEKPATGETFVPANKWDFENDEITGNTTLVAHWLPMLTVTFTKTNEFDWAESELTRTPPFGVRQIPKGKTFEEMAALAALNKVGQPPVNNLDASDYKFPEAIRVGYTSVKWLNGTTEFTVKTKVTAATTLKADWGDPTYWTVTLDPNGGTVSGASKITVLNNDTVATPSDPTRAGYQFIQWNDAEGNEFIFKDDSLGRDANKVSSNMTLTAEWLYVEAKIDGLANSPYESLEKAIDDANQNAGSTIELLRDVKSPGDLDITEDTTFKFGSYTLTGGTFTVDSGVTLTIESGIFNGTAFAGAGNVAVNGGTLTGVKFDQSYPQLTIGTTAKFDETAARPINWNAQIAPDKWLAVTSSDGYYRCVALAMLTFDCNPVDGSGEYYYDVPIGKGETPAHAIAEWVAWWQLDNDPITVLKDPEGKTFIDWQTADNKTFDLSKPYTGADATLTANWETTADVWYYVYTDGTADSKVDPHKEVVKKNSSGKYVLSGGWDPSAVVDEHNTLVQTIYPDEFDCWVDVSTGDVVKFPKELNAGSTTVLVAQMKEKLVFNYQDLTTRPVVVQAKLGDKYTVYKDQIPAVPAGSDGWVNEDNTQILNPASTISAWQEIEDGIISFVPLYADKTDWDLINVFPDNGYTYQYDEKSATGTVKFAGTAKEPIVFQKGTCGYGPTSSDIELAFTVEAPASVKYSDTYQIQFDNGAWTDLTGWDGRTPNNNYYLKVEKPLTLDQIKSAAKSKSTLNFSFKLREKGATEPCVTYTATFDPSNVKFVWDTDPVTDFQIVDGAYTFTLAYDTDGGTPAIDPVTVDYGTKVTVVGGPSKDYCNFKNWVDEDGEEYNMGGEIVVKKDTVLTAVWEPESANVEIYNHGDYYDVYTYLKTDLVSSIVLPEPLDPDYEIFDEWQYRDSTGTLVPFEYEEDDVIGDLYGYGYLFIYANYVPATNVCFYNDAWSKAVLEIKAPTGQIASKFYAENKDAITAAEEEIPGFKYWTDGTYRDGKYVKYVFGETAIVSDLYPIAEANTVTFVIADDVPDEKVKIATGSTVQEVLDAAPVIEDDNFEGWFDSRGKAFTEYESTWTLKNDITLTAHYYATGPAKVTFVGYEDTVLSEVVLRKGSYKDTVLAAANAVDHGDLKEFFDTWYVGSKTFDEYAGDGWTLESDLTLTAHYLVPVTFFTKIGDTKGTEVKVPYGAAIPADKYPTVADPNFVFWSEAAPGTQEFPKKFDTSTKITKAISLWAVFEEPEFLTTLNLADYTGIYVYIGIPETADASQLSVVSTYKSYRQENNQKVQLSSLPKGTGEKSNMYRFDALHAASTEMSDVVTVKLMKGTEVLKEEQYSVRSIVEAKLAEGGLEPGVDTLYRALMQYGHYGQLVFHNKETDLPSTEGAPTLVAIPDSFAANDPTDFGTYVTKFEGKLDLNTATSMNLYFTLADGYSKDDFSFSVLDKDGNPYAKSSVTVSGSRVRVRIEGILSPQLDRNFKVVVTLKDDTTKSAEWTRSVMTCAYETAKNSNDANVVNLMKALYQYMLAAQFVFPTFK